MPKAVRFAEYGGLAVLKVVEVKRPVPGPREALVKVVAASINPGEAFIRQGILHDRFPATFPSGQGSDFAGVITELGDEVAGFAAGDEVIGFTNRRASHAEYVVVEVNHLIHRPANVPWEQAGSLYVVGSTAYGVVGAAGVVAGDTVVVSGAAGGVGSVIVQLAKRAGANVIGLASESNHAWLAEHDVIPVTYGEGVADRIRDAVSGPIDAFIDTFGAPYVELAVELGVSPDRIVTIMDFAGAEKYGVKAYSNASSASAEVLRELATLIADGELEIPIARVYRLNEIREAFEELERRHTRGKIVLKP